MLGRIFRVFLFILGVTVFVFISVVIYTFIPFKLKVYKTYEYDVKQVEITDGDTWNLMTSEKHKVLHQNNYHIKLPDVDFKKNYLYITYGKKAKKFTYHNFRLYDFFEREIYVGVDGEVVWETKYNPNKIYIYLTERRELMPPEN
jgi:hypothetical protein